MTRQTVIDALVSSSPVAVIDMETTGLHPGADRVVEVSVVRIEPGKEPALVLDTLINPGRRVAATEIHGITDADVADAPRFEDIAEVLTEAISGAVLAAYNVYFDMRFLEDELARLRFQQVPPYVCLMYLRPMLGLGRKCCLSDACRAHGIPHVEVHTAAIDALAGADLWRIYLDAMADRDILTFRDLGSLKAYKFVESLRFPLLDRKGTSSSFTGHLFKPRVAERLNKEGLVRAGLVHEYFDAVVAAVADLEITEEEAAELEEKCKHLRLLPDEIRAVHGHVFSAALTDTLADSLITQSEWERLRRLHTCLVRLGWAPGM